jgi:hypothetical protein
MVTGWTIWLAPHHSSRPEASFLFSLFFSLPNKPIINNLRADEAFQAWLETLGLNQSNRNR